MSLKKNINGIKKNYSIGIIGGGQLALMLTEAAKKRDLEVGVIKALIVLFVFVNIVYSTGFDPIGGIVDLVNTFLDGGFAGLLALLVFLSFLA